MQYESVVALRIVLAVIAVLVGAYSINIFAKKSLKTEQRKYVTLLLFWSFAPPIWFFWEYWLMDHGCFQLPKNVTDKDKVLASIKVYAEYAANIWAAVLAVIVILYTRKEAK